MLCTTHNGTITLAADGSGNQDLYANGSSMGSCNNESGCCKRRRDSCRQTHLKGLLTSVYAVFASLNTQGAQLGSGCFVTLKLRLQIAILQVANKDVVAILWDSSLELCSNIRACPVQPPACQLVMYREKHKIRWPLTPTS